MNNNNDQGLIEIISASRHSSETFWQETALGQSIQRLSPDSRLSFHIRCSNTRGLPEVYNARLAQDEGPDIKVFMHDDVWIDDHFFVEHIISGLQHYDVIGVAGTTRRVPNQPGWACIGIEGKELVYEKRKYLSGVIAHGQQPFGKLARFGAVPATCELLDGVMLAARRSVLRANAVMFDPLFDFHYYDLDFCRTARNQGLSLGTWPIALTHQSQGVLGPHWHHCRRIYFSKWLD